MKNKKYHGCLLVLIMCYNVLTYGQVSIAGNSGTSGNYDGWNGSQAFPLDIRHNGKYPIDFYTDSIHYMQLDTIGLLGLSDTWTGFNPKSVLHCHRSGNTSIFGQFTNGNTGTTNNSGFVLGLNFNGFSSVAQLKQCSNSHMIFYTNNTQRMRIDSTGNVSINTDSNRAMLNVWGRNNITTSIWRDGIMMYNRSALIFDADTSTSNTNRWYFIAAPSFNPSGDAWQGLVPGLDGTSNPQYVYQLYGKSRANEPVQGHHHFLTTILADDSVGVGTIWPSKRVEVVDHDTTQLRLTRRQNTTSPSGSTATDFQTTSLGNLYINPHDSVTQRSVGINKFSPITTLHVGGTPDTSGAITSDYLNHRYSPASPASDTNIWIVYSDTNGTLKNLPHSTDPNYVLHGDGTWGAGGNGNVSTGCGGTTTNYIPKFSTPATTICNSQIYDDPTYGVGIGTTSLPTISPLQKLTVDGNLNLSSEVDGFYLDHRRFISSGGNSHLWNTYLGLNSGPDTASLTNAYGDICVGNYTGSSMLTNESYNIFIGDYSGYATQARSGHSEAYGNVFVGNQCGDSNTIGYLNVFAGISVGSQSNMDSVHNDVIIGPWAGTSAGWGNYDIIIGSNTQIGDFSGYNYGVAIGANSNLEGNNSVVLGPNSFVASDSTIVLGDDYARTLIGFNSIPTSSYTYAIDSAARLYVSPIGYNNGDNNTRAANFIGSIAATTVHLFSDSRLKNNIQPMGDVTQILDQLSPKTYFYDQHNHPEMHLPSGLQYGLIAQDVENVLPNLVENEFIPPIVDTLKNIIVPTQTFKALNYTGLIPLLLKGYKDQKNKIDSLVRNDSIVMHNDSLLLQKDSINSARLDQLEQLINSCCNNNGSGRMVNPSINIELSNSIILLQNDPNPFSESTKINYNIPSEISDAKIIFFDNEGHIIQTVKINERGAGQLNVYASNLTSGIYSYSLIADGKVIDTKKMVCNK